MIFSIKDMFLFVFAFKLVLRLTGSLGYTPSKGQTLYSIFDVSTLTVPAVCPSCSLWPSTYDTGTKL